MYVGKADDGITVNKGLGERVVLKLTESIKAVNHHVYLDNYFSTPSLFSTLLERGIYACGTVNPTRREFPEELKGKITMQQGEFTFRQSGSLVATVWKDKKLVTTLSTVCTADKSQPVQRRERDGTQKAVDCPMSVVTYNKYMAGVDKGDQLRSNYRVRLKSRKYYKYIFWFLFDVAITNAYILSNYTATTTTKPSLKNFWLKPASQLIHNYMSRARLGRRRLHPPLSLPPVCLDPLSHKGCEYSTGQHMEGVQGAATAALASHLTDGRQYGTVLTAKVSRTYA